ncbi:MAG: ATP-binding cassette domain-containing protein [Pseudomonadales bacterium]|nr:ATP-binding cassette domain-containing protein [Pseudomonadales bacterium]
MRLDTSQAPIIQVTGLDKRYGNVEAASSVTFEVNQGQIFGLIGPDGAGKTSIIQCLAGVLSADAGKLSIASFDCLTQPERVKPLIGYMPQGIGLNLYDALSVQENISFFAELRQVPVQQFKENRGRLLEMTRLTPFINRAAGKLSGGMRQKLALICTLIHLPDILLLDEPTTGVDPLSRRDFWQIIHDLVQERQVTVLMTTSYMDEAERCHQVALMHDARIIGSGAPQELIDEMAGRIVQVHALENARMLPVLEQWPGAESIDQQGDYCRILLKAGARSEQSLAELQSYCNNNGIQAWDVQPVAASLEDVFVYRVSTSEGLPPIKANYFEPTISEQSRQSEDPIISAKGLSCQFGDFVAVNNVSMQVQQGEVFGLLGPNGAGKTTLIKMLMGLQAGSQGSATVAGLPVSSDNFDLRYRLGYMSQRFSLYRDLSVAENLKLYGGLYGLNRRQCNQRIVSLAARFHMQMYLDRKTESLPLGIRQRVALSCALLHKPSLLLLDEPTSGVDPIARRQFWREVHRLVEHEQVSVLISTHYMDEAEHCDRLGFMQRGKMVATGTPAELKQTAEQFGGPLVTVDSRDFVNTFTLLKPVFENAIYFGRRIQWQSLQAEQALQEAQNILRSAKIEARLRIIPLSIEEAFVSFMLRDADKPC